jgi:hypothetical protein
MAMDDLTVAALHLDALNPREWGVYYSTYTEKWYVHAKGLNLTDGSFLTGTSVHRLTPGRAVIEFVEELKAEGQGSQVVSVEARGQRRYYRWNGVTFAEVPDFLLPWADNT